MAKRRLKVQRSGYKRRKYHRKGFKRDHIYVPPTTVKATYVPPTTYYMKDIGEVGRSKEPYKGASKLKKGRMTEEIRKILGYPKRATELTASEWRKVFLGSKLSPRTWAGMILTQVARRKYAEKGSERYKDKLAFKKAFRILSDVHDLTPREAIEKWKSMSHYERALVRKGGAI